MKTQSSNTIYLNKEKYEHDILKIWQKFLSGNTTTMIEETFTKVQKLLENRWIVMESDFVYDDDIKACWSELMQNDYHFYEAYSSGTDLQNVRSAIREKYEDNDLDLPTYKELTKSLSKIKTTTPFKTTTENGVARLYCTPRVLYIDNNLAQGFYINFNFCKCNIENSRAIPLIRLTNKNNFDISDRETFFRFIVIGFLPSELKEDKLYNSLLDDYKYSVEDFFTVKNIELVNKKLSISKRYIANQLLNEDKLRADLTAYNYKMLEDIDQGHWSLWNMEKFKSENSITATIKESLVARDPASSINDGVVGIDFGTKSTVVVYQKDNVNIHPMRVGTGELDKGIASHHYENPTIMEFNDLDKFIDKYNKNEFRPFTQWDDLTISHTAHNSLMGSASKDFNTFLDELKQWAGDKNRQLKIIDKKAKTIDLPPFLNLEDEFNPIEIYAYYLGLNINNQYNGIYLNYILSFPVTYEKDIRAKILESFKKGIKKSLPSQLDSSYIDKLSVESGASEPAAYAIVALDEYGFDPEDDERIFYGVFDFGGGTTDFDFGIYREANGVKERRYDYAIEHFGAGGDKYLGGENLLELLAFEVFKKNKDKLLQQSIQFEKHPEKDTFAGSEKLLNNSREAKMNTKVLSETLRGFWENDPEKKDDYEKGTLNINLTDIDGKQLAGFELDISHEELYNILYKRIEKGIKAFFEQLRLAFSHKDIHLQDIETINIFLAGNSSKSHILKTIFEKELEIQENKIKEDTNQENIFKLYQPLSNDDNDIEKPTGKTGVAFGLIKSRKSGKVLVVDHNIGEDINFKYYLGHRKKKNFRVDIDREDSYNQWIDFIDAGVNQFEIFYRSYPVASTDELSIDDESIKKLLVTINIVDENALVYIRLVSPTQIEYVVALGDEIKQGKYLCDIQNISLA